MKQVIVTGSQGRYSFNCETIEDAKAIYAAREQAMRRIATEHNGKVTESKTAYKWAAKLETKRYGKTFLMLDLLH